MRTSFCCIKLWVAILTRFHLTVCPLINFQSGLELYDYKRDQKIYSKHVFTLIHFDHSTLNDQHPIVLFVHQAKVTIISSLTIFVFQITFKITWIPIFGISNQFVYDNRISFHIECIHFGHSTTNGQNPCK